MVRQLGELLVRIASNQRPFAVTNLGVPNGSGVELQGRRLQVESFSGAVTGIVDSSVLTDYTIGGRMRLHLLANESSPSDTAAREEGERAVKRLLDAIEDPPDATAARGA